MLLSKEKYLIFTVILFLVFISRGLTYDSETRTDLLHTIKKSPQIQEEILILVTRTVVNWAKYEKVVSPFGEGSWVMWERAGVFITFEKYGKLRGCRGTLFPSYPSLAEEIINATIGAASRDKRVSPITFEELKKLHVTVTIVGEVKHVTSPETEINPLIHGIMVQHDDKKGIMLPQEAPTLEKEIEWAKKRANILPDEEVEIFSFTGVRFSGNIKDFI
jgi:uncharacterized protein (TIGR00296 family)